MSLVNLLHRSYWFAVATPPFLRASFIIVLVIIGAIFVTGIVLRIIANKKRNNPPLKNGLIRLSRPFFFLAIVLFILVWFRQLGAVILSARAWLALIVIIAGLWFGFALRVVLRSYKVEYARLQEKWKYQEYLPKKKR